MKNVIDIQGLWKLLRYDVGIIKKKKKVLFLTLLKLFYFPCLS